MSSMAALATYFKCCTECDAMEGCEIQDKGSSFREEEDLIERLELPPGTVATLQRAVRGHPSAQGALDEPGQMYAPNAVVAKTQQNTMKGEDVPDGFGAGTSSPGDAAVDSLRLLIRQFVQRLLRGAEFLIVLEGGEEAPSQLFISKDLHELQLHFLGSQHGIDIKNIQRICPGKDLKNIWTSIPLDDLCSTLVLKNGECVTFKLGSIPERDDFGKCLNILHLAAKQESSKVPTRPSPPVK
mmetsp:Transcript_4093/g.9081  ORF Transcript_4093/g.9081 Transcript_4093/m.9081 type:complete len:241 (+) Transcript_4093:65-787(+)